ncbi:phospholipid/glycerol acyltransferase [Psychromonas sp. CNPT3]|uniref:1-acyl-sn-glycerol-3-phosphate acyltransferase n=1 Tax=Psychromonas sp. CNPT3 TaxID=314282 RepID=UPI00006E9E74|nr:1-acyl-sn-glycerol-3-phosphate acyltransferase [Psychromonas sp. CNPT3]AGH80292.1 phospholipid/glycerol acyltransferase [Psychromonas sp. CNPT3]
MPISSDKFSDIRPYNDGEIQAAILRVINNDELINAIISFRFPKVHKLTHCVIRPLLRRYFTYKWGKINSIDEMQKVVVHYMHHMIKDTTTKFTSSGLCDLDVSKNYLFVSNHRDIAMDPALMNWALFAEEFQSARIATGDNLLGKPFIADLMRMNKSFIVKRSISAPREMLKALLHLSDYIFSSLQSDSSIWIAQREGRAKDGFDKTEPAIIKMFYINGKKKKIEFSDYINQLNIVPVAISYEFDACDKQKAKELYTKNKFGEYKKSASEDIDSIVAGIVGQKGHVHIAFGKPLEGDFKDADEVACAIDKQIYQNYYLHPSNYIAAKVNLDSIDSEDKERFAKRLNEIDIELQETVLKMYANPVKNAPNL